jgi:hypothetical protein
VSRAIVGVRRLPIPAISLVVRRPGGIALDPA